MISFFQSTKYITIFQLFKMTKMSFSVFELFFKIVVPILEKRTYLVSCVRYDRIKLTLRDSQAKKSRTFVASHPRLIRWYFWNALTPRISKQPLNTYRCKYFHKKILILYILCSFGTFDFAEFKRRGIWKCVFFYIVIYIDL